MYDRMMSVDKDVEDDKGVRGCYYHSCPAPLRTAMIIAIDAAVRELIVGH